MTDDKLAFIDAAPTEPVTETPAATPAAAATPEPTPQAQPQTPAPVPPAAPAPAVAATPEPSRQEGHTVPLAKYLDRDSEARDLKRQNAALQQQLQSLRNPVQAPDPVTDPEAFQDHLRQQMEQEFNRRLHSQRADMSEIMARQVHGDDKVNAAYDAMKAKFDPYEFNRIMASPHPWNELVKWHQRDQLLSQIGDKPDDWVRRRWAELNPAQPNGQDIPAAPQAPAAPVIPPQSLTRVPTAGKASDVPVGPGNAFDATFTR